MNKFFNQNSEIEQMRVSIDNLERENLELLDEITQRETKISSLKEETTTLKSRLINLDEVLETKELIIGDKEDEILNLGEQILDFKNELINCYDKLKNYDKLLQENDKLKSNGNVIKKDFIELKYGNSKCKYIVIDNIAGFTDVYEEKIGGYSFEISLKNPLHKETNVIKCSVNIHDNTEYNKPHLCKKAIQEEYDRILEELL